MYTQQRFTALLASLLVVCFFLYWPALNGPFLFDDFPNLSALTSIDHIHSWRELGIYLSQPRDFPGRPLAMLSFLAQKNSWPDHPFPFKLVNLLIHMCNGVLVARFTWLLARRYSTQDSAQTTTYRAMLVTLFATAAFLLNPIQLSPVLLVVQRMTLLMAMFTLLGLLCYIHALLATQASTFQRSIWMIAGIWGCTSLAFLSKENGILLPLYALVLDATILRTDVAKLPCQLQRLRRIMIWPLVLFILYFLLSKLSAITVVSSARGFSPLQRLLTEPLILSDYLIKIFLPRFGLYGLFNDGFQISHGLLTPPTTLLSIIAMIAAFILGWTNRRRRPLLALALFWYLGGQIMESSTIMLELYFEHRNYVPVIGTFTAIAIGMIGINISMQRRLATILATIWLGACAVTTSLSANVWSSEEKLAIVWSQQYPDSMRAQTMLIDQLYKHGKISTAGRFIENALINHPQNLGLAEINVYLQCTQGLLKPDNVKALEANLRTAPYDRAGFGNIERLRVLAEAKTCSALDIIAWKNIVTSALANPNYQKDGVATGFLHYQLHQLAVNTGDLNNAVRELNDANAADPNAEIPRLQAKYLASAGLYDQAIATLKQANYDHLPMLRRLLVNDRAIDADAVTAIKQQAISAKLKTIATEK